MGAVMDRVAAFFGQMGWPVNPTAEANALSFTYEGSNGKFVFVATADEDHRILVVYSRAPFACPEERRKEVAELLVRLNYGMTHGGFDMDFADGEIRYRAGVDLANLEITDGFLGALCRYNLASMDYYLPAVQAVAEGGASAEEASAATDQAS